MDSDSVRSTYFMIQDGFAPVLQDAQLVDSINLARQIAANVRADFVPSTWPTVANCQRFAKTVSATLDQIDQTLINFKATRAPYEMTDDQVLNSVRLRLLTASLFSLHSMFKQAHEGGFGLLDPSIKMTCALPHRETRETEFDNLIKDISQFSRSAMGNPGLLGFDQLTDRLLDIASRDEVNADRKSYALMAGTVVVSAVFWEVIPVVASSVGGMSFVPVAVTHPASVFVLRSVTLGLEGLAYYAVDRALLPQTRGDEQGLPTWDEQLNEIEKLNASGLDAPELYLSYLGQIQAQIATFYQPWLNQHQKEIRALTSAPAQAAIDLR